MVTRKFVDLFEINNFVAQHFVNIFPGKLNFLFEKKRFLDKTIRTSVKNVWLTNSSFLFGLSRSVPKRNTYNPITTNAIVKTIFLTQGV